MPITPTRLDTPRGILPEGIVWDPESARLTWVDIELGQLHAARIGDGIPSHIVTHELGDQVGCAVPAIDGGWVVGLGRSLATVSEEGVVHASPPLLRDRERFNDGHCDPQGRLVIGTLHSDGPDDEQLLVRLEHDGAIRLLDDGLGISNGLAWSPDGVWMYHADTAARTVTRRSYGDTDGPPEPFVAVDGMPDGIAVDADGRLWVTVFDAGRVDCYDPRGRRLPQLSFGLADAHITSVGFAGPDLDVLLVTTGMPIMREWLRRRRAQDGWLFHASAPGRGQSMRRWQPVPLPQVPLR